MLTDAVSNCCAFDKETNGPQSITKRKPKYILRFKDRMDNIRNLMLLPSVKKIGDILNTFSFLQNGRWDARFFIVAAHARIFWLLMHCTAKKAAFNIVFENNSKKSHFIQIQASFIV